jgi:outer membrane biosynthesis protein TonB
MKSKSKIIFSITTIAIIFLLGVAALTSNIGAHSQKTAQNNSTDQTNSVPAPNPTSGSQNPTSSTTPTPTHASGSDTTTPSPTPTPQQAFPTPTNPPTPTQSPTPTPSATPTPTPSQTPIPKPSPIPTPNPASTLFSDGFQSGNTSAWTNTDTSSVTLSVTNSMLKCSTNTATNNNWGYIYTWLNQTYTKIDWRWYVFFGNLPTTNGNTIGVGGMYNSAVESNFAPANVVCAVNVIRQNGGCYWRLDYVNNSTFYSQTSTLTVSPNTWYLIELEATQGNKTGEIHFYLNDVETLNATCLINNHNGIDHVSVGGGITADQPISWYCDSAVASTEHIGPAAPTNNVFSTTNQLIAKEPEKQT